MSGRKLSTVTSERAERRQDRIGVSQREQICVQAARFLACRRRAPVEPTRLEGLDIRRIGKPLTRPLET